MRLRARGCGTPLLVVLGLALPQCGGRSENAPGTAPDAVNGGGPIEAVAGACAVSDDDACGGAGGAGDMALEPDAPARGACGRSIIVNRRGGPIRVCFHIE